MPSSEDARRIDSVSFIWNAALTTLLFSWLNAILGRPGGLVLDTVPFLSNFYTIGYGISMVGGIS